MFGKVFLLFVLCLQFVCLYPMAIVHADGQGAIIGLKPVFLPSEAHALSNLYFIFKGVAGEKISGSIFINNTGKSLGKVDIYGVDATTGATSGAVYQDKEAVRHDVGKWLTLAMSSVVLAAGQGKYIPFTVNVPRSVRVGEHVGGIVAELDDQVAVPTPSAGSGSFFLRMRHLTIIAVQITIPGPVVEQLRVTGIRAGVARQERALLVGLNNIGTVMVKPSITILIRTKQGALFQKQVFQLDTILPQTAIEYPIVLNQKGFRSGRYQVTLVMQYGQKQVVRYQTEVMLSSLFTQYGNGSTSATQTSSSSNGLLSSFSFWLILLAGLFLLGLVFACGFLFARRGTSSSQRERR